VEARSVTHKYNAIPTTVDGRKFPSRAEANRYGELKLMEKAGVICGLELQPKYKCYVNGLLVCTYAGDFRYRDNDTRELVIEDVKGYKTPVYKLKKKLVKACYGIDIYETTGR
jgi:hypothetical protein